MASIGFGLRPDGRPTRSYPETGFEAVSRAPTLAGTALPVSRLLVRIASKLVGILVLNGAQSPIPHSNHETALPSGTRRCCVLGQGAQHGIEQIRILKVGFISGLFPLYG
jgi:hypothetical protein